MNKHQVSYDSKLKYSSIKNDTSVHSPRNTNPQISIHGQKGKKVSITPCMSMEEQQ